MNILLHELKTNSKTFLFWSLGLFFLMFAGMMKFVGFSEDGGQNINVLMGQLPRVVLAVFGLADVDITSIGGYYSVIVFYVLICASIYGVSNGVNCINREAIDKTTEFLFTKPRSRYFILKMKMISAVIFQFAFSLVSYIFAVAAINSLEFENTIKTAIIIYSVIIFFMEILFYSIGMFVATISRRVERGALYGSLIVVIVFIVSIVYDTMEDGGILKVFVPFKYFSAQDVLSGNLDMKYIFLIVCISIILSAGSLFLYEKKDI